MAYSFCSMMACHFHFPSRVQGIFSAQWFLWARRRWW